MSKDVGRSVFVKQVFIKYCNPLDQNKLGRVAMKCPINFSLSLEMVKEFA